jgi:Protein of unknown function (DUF4235)
MSKILFLPFSIVGGLVAGAVGKRLFEALWSLFDEQEPPDPKRRDASWKRVLAALVLQGAIFRAVRGVIDRASREAFSKLTGSWPGEERAQQG